MKPQAKYKIIGITPARGGSKTIPKKNIKLIAGKPLIAWTIQAAQESKLLDRYVVSTDNEEIAKVALKYKAEVIKRPKNLALDTTPTLPVLQHILKNIPADIVVLLQCTSPVREKGLIDKCIKKFIQSKCDVLATGYISQLFEWGTYNKQRQKLKGFFHDDGNIVIYKASLLKKGKTFSKNKTQVLISKEQNFEIDDQFDFWLNEQILKSPTLKK